MYKRKIYDTIIKRLGEQRMFIQVIMGPRQIGKIALSRYKDHEERKDADELHQ